jgi:LacI family transcriptional regulator
MPRQRRRRGSAWRQAVKELGYSPNVAARNLARAPPLHIGLLYNNPSAAYLNELLVGVLEQSSQAGCQIVLEKCGTRNERAAIERLVRDGVGGIILPPPLSDSKRSRPCVRGQVPFIAVATGRPMRRAVRTHRRFRSRRGHDASPVVAGASRYRLHCRRANQTVSAQRQAGFEKALTEAGLRCVPNG